MPSSSSTWHVRFTNFFDSFTWDVRGGCPAVRGASPVPGLSVPTRGVSTLEENWSVKAITDFLRSRSGGIPGSSALGHATLALIFIYDPSRTTLGQSFFSSAHYVITGSVSARFHHASSNLQATGISTVRSNFLSSASSWSLASWTPVAHAGRPRTTSGRLSLSLSLMENRGLLSLRGKHENSGEISVKGED